MRAWIDKMLSMQARLIDIARSFQMEKDAKHVAANEPDQLTEFAINSFVLARYPETAMGNRPPTKLHTNWRGPFRVVNRNSNGSVYTLQEMNTLKTFDVHVSLLKEYVTDRKMTAEEATMPDKQLFAVEKIINHFGDITKKSSLFFQVKWDGYEGTTREPWSHLRHNVKLHQYLAKKPSLRHLIPEEYKKDYNLLAEVLQKQTRSRKRKIAEDV
jgi:hypothetical protein